MSVSIFRDRARGAILGALIGDAAGATLEFLGRMPTSDDVRLALRITGGGIWQTAPGQITDDGEMTLALCRALASQENYSPSRAASAYRRWRLSEPFDVGFATDAALSEGDWRDPRLADIVYRNAKQHNFNSQANGCLMRASPLGVWATRVDLPTAIEVSRQDTLLTHPHEACQWMTAAYVVAIRHLMLNPGDHRGAFKVAESILPDGTVYQTHMHLAQTEEVPCCTTSAGHIAIAFRLAFHHLYRGSEYVEALKSVLACGGDTDTNACIVGGLIGALVGSDSLPELMQQMVLKSDTNRGQPRPDWLHPRHLDKLIDELLPESSRQEPALS